MDSDKFIITGGKRLEGSVEISGAKNSALSIMAATLLTKDVCILRNIPHLTDVDTMIAVIRKLGIKVEWKEDNTLYIDSDYFNNYEAPYELVKKMRASILVMGPLLARLNKAKISLPGGCAIGARPVDFHIKGFETLGAQVEVEKGYIKAEVNKLRGGDIYLDFPSLGATENIMMAASLAEGVTKIENAAKDPEVVELGNFLIKMGAKIEGLGTDLIKINGVKKLNGVDYNIIPDRIEAGTYMIAAAITSGDILIEKIDPLLIKPLIVKLEEAGVKIKQEKDFIEVIGPNSINAVDIKTLPYPGFPTDIQPQFMALSCVAKGTSVITETVFENRFAHTGDLIRMGADIKVEGRSAIIKGVKKLSAAPVMASDLRGGAALILAGLVADGTTELSRIYHLDRGYVNLEKKLTALGADIHRVEE
ncbi:MAG: UDP-N-acetylglucosamine 1-carboxyvinyltransferase [Candidatus Infernicultor aquiphilus]|uniref:UDP-N-acetylglucosamine 1-carboxyvinyltransferase n=1 Tax=Candidatus Infernicultor aquiphilus TaxID=1805029 RepID=A0A1J5G9X0_9BACT|nr:UDP-N-acetylglucosamine 1-carboxyvinyltransferase [bacterium]OIP69513.1 MAG: UDP-N-acetylglucosamine 1-carboxyvinyltransferase [Candidatus Atribacteria bacterium CG2_30_33_13]PIU25007.1 MAG: UDP-N-acetylglucosamine 1-carboxyvinyltransferase [Candidatus Atribacteria bacterium CG08_land_8_20_14_0_20_33_29]PIW12434.1 MAG: UDP-N-acetylglucosamine 1-carboxyvinyltransferase [Candidatus Atribacteria bacterium CG17_big_fil_post_rev_8_21_14_2_50_34_11]PIX34696.1 MAG: UDP-N-acetylglucosamine 1-carboxy